MFKFTHKSVAIFAAACLTIPTVSVAQQGNGLLEEIIVTASKRASTLQEIPIAVSVTTAETIEKAQILDISDLQSVVPSLRVSQLQNSTNTNFVIRGFGNGANNPGIEPSVGVFIDGVYRSRSAGAISDLPALQRVEVLRGPQSTLFGKNASAGVISVITRKPSGESAGRVAATVGNFGQVVLKGQVEGALSDSAAYMLSAGSNTRDGYVKNLTTGNDINSRDRQSFRGQLVLNPSDNTEVRIIADYDTIDEQCCSTVNLISGPTAGAIRFAGGNIVDDDAEALELYGSVDPTNQLDNSGISMQIDHDFENFALTSITSFRNVDSFSNIDSDFTSADIITNAITTDIDTFTQEIRLTSTNGDKL
ncbi:MAG: iron complex outermembrane receptor protein, partial [Dinoroseobacter sp.]